MFVAVAPGAQSQAQAQADSPLRARLSAEHVGDIVPGEYSAGDDLVFDITPYGDKFLLHFSDAPETYVLDVERASLGGHVLKYDYGATALRVSSWGGLTIYTDTAPNGLPATRIADAPPPAAQMVSSGDLQNALHDETDHLQYLWHMKIDFSAHDAGLASDGAERLLAFEALSNTAYGLDRLGADDAARKALGKLAAVDIAPGDKPDVELAGQTLRVHFVAGEGLAGLASSQSVARALAQQLAVPYRN